MAIAASMRMNAEGIKVLISGRLNGAEMARSEGFKDGRVPYQLSEPILIMH
jgi:small subunit ribosomal protein S3